MTASNSFAEMDMTEALKMFRKMILKQLLDSFEGATLEWEQLACAEFDWPRLCKVGKAACCLAQLIHLKISDIQRRREMPFTRTLRLFRRFSRLARPVVDSLTDESRPEYEALRHHVQNIGTRIESLDLMDKRSSAIDKSFGLNTKDEDEDIATPSALHVTC